MVKLAISHYELRCLNVFWVDWDEVERIKSWVRGFVGRLKEQWEEMLEEIVETIMMGSYRVNKVRSDKWKNTDGAGENQFVWWGFGRSVLWFK